MRHRSLLALLLLAAALRAPALTPNVILINCDDLGYGGLGERQDVAGENSEASGRLLRLAEEIRQHNRP